jgi:hypothetical protein
VPGTRNQFIPSSLHGNKEPALPAAELEKDAGILNSTDTDGETTR